MKTKEYVAEDTGNYPTIAYVRDAVRKGAYVGDLFEALEFMLQEYDFINSKLRVYTQPVEYSVSRTGADVV